MTARIALIVIIGFIGCVGYAHAEEPCIESCSTLTMSDGCKIDKCTGCPNSFMGLDIHVQSHHWPGICPNVSLVLDCENYVYPACVGARCMECCYDQKSEGFNCANTQLNDDVQPLALACKKWNSETQTWKTVFGAEFTICDF